MARHPKLNETWKQYKQLGNSVSIPVIEEITKYIYKTLEEFKMGFNREWLKLYHFIYWKIQISIVVDENLEVIDNTLFKILEIILSDKKYKIQAQNIIKLFNNGQAKNYSIIDLSEQNKIILKKILTHKSAKGSFEISEIQTLIDDFDAQKPKGTSNIKADLTANVLDNKRNQNFNIS